MSEYNEPKEKAPMPFNVVEKMMAMYPLVAVMGWAIVLFSFLVGLTQLSPAVGDWLEQTKDAREGNSDLIDTWQTIHVLETWVPNLKFFGLGLGLMAITMALGTIAMRLRTMAYMINTHRELQIPPKPKAVRLMQGSAMMGIMILLITTIIGFVLAFGVVSDYYGAGTQTELNQGTAGSTDDLGTIQAFPHWLNTLRMVGMAFLLAAITFALKVITGTLKLQNKQLSEIA
ncbi:MAG: hypothetical protein ACW99A_23370 [Candidatus Kariarchaeaceae archaeon]|jgi:hypothetical protein